jgi:hypothetical protein
MGILDSTLVKPKVIDLDKYGINAAINAAIAGGGMVNYALDVEMSEFWEEVQSDRPLNVKFTFIGNEVVNIRTNNVTTLRLLRFDRVTQISFGAAVDMGTGLIEIDIIINNTSKNGTLTVKVS